MRELLRAVNKEMCMVTLQEGQSNQCFLFLFELRNFFLCIMFILFVLILKNFSLD